MLLWLRVLKKNFANAKKKNNKKQTNKQGRSTYLQTREAIMAMVLIKIKTKLIRYTFSVILF